MTLSNIIEAQKSAKILIFLKKLIKLFRVQYTTEQTDTDPVGTCEIAHLYKEWISMFQAFKVLL